MKKLKRREWWVWVNNDDDEWWLNGLYSTRADARSAWLDRAPPKWRLIRVREVLPKKRRSVSDAENRVFERRKALLQRLADLPKKPKGKR